MVRLTSEASLEAALTAWRTVHPGPRSRPRAVTLNAHRTSTVYRLLGVGPRGTDVIAKRAPRRCVEGEYRLYSDLLPRLPLRSVRCYGVAEDSDPAMGWLFLEDAGDARYSPERAEHRRLAAWWLATLHTAAADLGAAATVPRLGAPYYRGLIERWRGAMAPGFASPAFTTEHRAALRGILGHAEVLLDHWSEVEQLCAQLPHTLVHADFQAKNLRVGIREGGVVLLVFDWETAGWGPPGIDLAWIDIDEYARQIGRAWPALGSSEMRALTGVGTLFYLASCIEWETWAFRSEWMLRRSAVLTPMQEMRLYEPRLRAAIAEMGWI